METSRALRRRLGDLVKNPLIQNAGYLLGINTFPALMGFLFWTLAGRLCPDSEVGLASAVISAASLLSCLAAFGTNLGLVRFMAEHPAPHRLLNSVLAVNAICSIIGTLIFYIGIPLWTPQLYRVIYSKIWIFLFFIFVLASTWGTTIRDSFTACRRSKLGFVHTTATNLLRLELILPAIQAGAVGMVGATALAFLISFLASVLILAPKAYQGYRWSFRMHWHDIQAILPFSLSNFLTLLLFQVTQAGIPLMTVELLGTEANAYSFMALMVGLQIVSPGTALATSALAEGVNSRERSPQILRQALLTALAITVPLAILVFLAAPWILSIFGPAYAREASNLLRWLTLSAVFQVINQLYFTKLRLEKKNFLLIFLSIASTCTTLILAYCCLRRWGITANGIAIASGNLISALPAASLVFSTKPVKVIEK